MDTGCYSYCVVCIYFMFYVDIVYIVHTSYMCWWWGAEVCRRIMDARRRHTACYSYGTYFIFFKFDIFIYCMYTTYMLYMSGLLKVVCRRIVDSRRRLSACYVYCVYFIFIGPKLVLPAAHSAENNGLAHILLSFFL